MGKNVFVTAAHPERGTLWACVDPTARCAEGRVAERRFGSFMAPFKAVADARAALVAAGAVAVDASAK